MHDSTNAATNFEPQGARGCMLLPLSSCLDLFVWPIRIVSVCNYLYFALRYCSLFVLLKMFLSLFCCDERYLLCTTLQMQPLILNHKVPRGVCFYHYPLLSNKLIRKC